MRRTELDHWASSQIPPPPPPPSSSSPPVAPQVSPWLRGPRLVLDLFCVSPFSFSWCAHLGSCLSCHPWLTAPRRLSAVWTSLPLNCLAHTSVFVHQAPQQQQPTLPDLLLPQPSSTSGKWCHQSPYCLDQNFGVTLGSAYCAPHNTNPPSSSSTHLKLLLPTFSTATLL